MGFVICPDVPAAGLRGFQLGRNGTVAAGPSMAQLASFVNMLTGRRKKILFSQFGAGSIYGGRSTGAMYIRFITSMQVQGVTALIIARKHATFYSNFVWTVGGVTHPTRSIGPDAAAASSPSAIVGITQPFVDAGGNALPGGSIYDATLQPSAFAQVIGVIVYEEPSSSLETSDFGIVVDSYDVGAPVTGAGIYQIVNQLWNLQTEGGTTHISWTAETLGGSTANATYKNIVDASTTGYAAGAAGFWTYPYRKGTLTNTTVPVVLWCYSSATTGSVQFSNSGGVIGTITGIGAAGYYSTTATLDGTLTSDLVIVEHKDTAGTITTHSAGMYEQTT